MTAEERDREIEWLMESIKRSAAGGHGMTFTLIFVSVAFISFGIFALFFFDRYRHCLVMFLTKELPLPRLPGNY